MAAWKLSLSDWADRYFHLSAESCAEPGRWRSLPYQRGIMDAFTDPSVTHVSVMKSARVGWTKIVNALIGYSMHQDPCPILVVQPTVDDAKGYSKEEIAPMLRDCPVLSAIVFEDAEDTGPRDSGNTILHKKFPGGVLSMVGANSGAGFRRVSRKRVLCDEADAYPPSAGSDGDPVKLASRRAEYYWDRKLGCGSTPLIAGASRIERLFEEGDQRRYFVPCLQCGHVAPLVFSGDKGHAMAWPPGKPEEAHFVCQRNGCVIEHKDKRAMVEAGEWRAARPFTGHASFHVWAAYSYSPNATWAQLATEFLEAKDNPETLRTFVNTVLGETWQEKGEAPEWERLYGQREQYPIGAVQPAVLVLTCGVDVQKDRWIYEVVGWGAGKESWSVDAGIIPGDTSNESEWTKLDELLARTYCGPGGVTHAVRVLAVDSGYNTNTVYAWARRHVGRVIAVKGVATARTLLGAPTPVDVTLGGRRVARGCKVWPVGVDVAKQELYGWLRLTRPEPGATFPPGWMHFPSTAQTTSSNSSRSSWCSGATRAASPTTNGTSSRAARTTTWTPASTPALVPRSSAWIACVRRCPPTWSPSRLQLPRPRHLQPRPRHLRRAARKGSWPKVTGIRFGVRVGCDEHADLDPIRHRHPQGCGCIGRAVRQLRGAPFAQRHVPVPRLDALAARGDARGRQCGCRAPARHLREDEQGVRPVNLLDTLALAPGWALKRARARLAASQFARHYEAAQPGRRTSGWTRNRGDANAVNGVALAELRMHARDLVRNDGWARRVQRVIANNTVGWGIVPRPEGPEAKKAAKLWKSWADAPTCGADGRATFGALQALVLRSLVTDGEVIVRRVQRATSDGVPLNIQLQVLEADYLDTTKDEEKSQSLLKWSERARALKEQDAGPPNALAHAVSERPDGRAVGPH
ncbi:phage portal protein [Corallococcus sp. ZKHCc1 1396]|uniref:Phage portal protein n=1 Tax=Corallococcus soli TaxID=2710757 RepID=A0ABR9PGX1_9BACT|nr:terminase gpA endonuclease subunit [Corallococcus soli]MBE4747164.1 phage portal protein [Corallococcus soli]